MLERTLLTAILLGLGGGMCLLSADRPDLSGSWQLDTSRSVVHSHVPGSVWRIEQNDESIRLIQLEGDKSVDDYKCWIGGKECKIKDEGRAAKVSFYYNGPVLVELEESGDAVIKRRWQLSDDKSVLTVEVMHVMPIGKEPEKLVLTKKAEADTTKVAASSSK